MIKIGIVDESRLFRKSIEILLNSFGNMQVIIDTNNEQDLLEKLNIINIDVLLIDIQLQKTDGISLCKLLKLHFPRIRIFIVSQANSKDIILKMIELGMDGFFSKNSDPIQLKNAIKATESADFQCDSDMEVLIKQSLIWEKRNQNKSRNNSISITSREMEIIKLACQEYSSSEIADILNINVRTVDTHRKRLLEKTKTKNFIGVVLYALKNKLLSLEGI